jgi:hypothetical protein
MGLLKATGGKTAIISVGAASLKKDLYGLRRQAELYGSISAQPYGRDIARGQQIGAEWMP